MADGGGGCEDIAETVSVCHRSARSIAWTVDGISPCRQSNKARSRCANIATLAHTHTHRHTVAITGTKTLKQTHAHKSNPHNIDI